MLETTKEQNIALVYSGDTGFYSGASALCRVLDERHIGCTVIPGVSSVQLLSAAIHEPWQNWNLVSAHGCACDPVAACSMGKPTFFLTGGEVTPAVICAKLTESRAGETCRQLSVKISVRHSKKSVRIQYEKYLKVFLNRYVCFL